MRTFLVVICSLALALVNASAQELKATKEKKKAAPSGRGVDIASVDGQPVTPATPAEVGKTQAAGSKPIAKFARTKPPPAVGGAQPEEGKPQKRKQAQTAQQRTPPPGHPTGVGAGPKKTSKGPYLNSPMFRVHDDPNKAAKGGKPTGAGKAKARGKPAKVGKTTGAAKPRMIYTVSHGYDHAGKPAGASKPAPRPPVIVHDHGGGGQSTTLPTTKKKGEKVSPTPRPQ